MTECRNDSAGNGHRRVLNPGRDAHDPAGLLATAHLPSDVRPATLDGAERHLAESLDTDPGTPPSVLLDRAARCRAVLAGLLAAMAEPEQPRMPPALAPFAARWMIAFGLAWTAERRVG